jgi:hypothetical protein
MKKNINERERKGVTKINKRDMKRQILEREKQRRRERRI